MERQSVTVKVYCGEEFQHGEDWPTPGYPATLVGAIAWFNAKLLLIPEEYRADARCEIDSVTSYGEPYARIWITYDRPETDDEMAARVAEQQRQAAAVDARERETLRRLREKYDDAKSI